MLYILGINYRVFSFKGICIAYIHRLDEDDDKLIIVPVGENYSNEEIERKVNLQEKYFRHIIVR